MMTMITTDTDVHTTAITISSSSCDDDDKPDAVKDHSKEIIHIRNRLGEGNPSIHILYDCLTALLGIQIV